MDRCEDGLGLPCRENMSMNVDHCSISKLDLSHILRSALIISTPLWSAWINEVHSWEGRTESTNGTQLGWLTKMSLQSICCPGSSLIAMAQGCKGISGRSMIGMVVNLEFMGMVGEPEQSTLLPRCQGPPTRVVDSVLQTGPRNLHSWSARGSTSTIP